MAIQKLEAAFDEFKAFVAGGAPDLGVPQDIQITKTTFVTPAPALAVIDLGWTAVEGADGYDVEHEFGNVYAPDMRLVEHVATNACTIGGTKPFLVAAGASYTVAVYATQGGKRAPVPGVAVLTVPAYEAPAPVAPPEPAFPTPVATVAGVVSGDALTVALAVGAPGADLSTATSTQFVVDSGAYECALDAATAIALGLPNLGPATVGGVGGSAQAFNTEVDVQIGDAVYRGVRAVAIEGFGQNLWGLRFAIDRQYILAVDTVKATLSYYQG